MARIVRTSNIFVYLVTDQSRTWHFHDLAQVRRTHLTHRGPTVRVKIRDPFSSLLLFGCFVQECKITLSLSPVRSSIHLFSQGTSQLIPLLDFVTDFPVSHIGPTVNHREMNLTSVRGKGGPSKGTKKVRFHWCRHHVTHR